MDLSTAEPQIVVEDGKTIKYEVIKSEIVTSKLEAEKAELEEALNAKEPTDKELVTFAKENHIFYAEKESDEERLSVINTILNK